SRAIALIGWTNASGAGVAVVAINAGSVPPLVLMIGEPSREARAPGALQQTAQRRAPVPPRVLSIAASGGATYEGVVAFRRLAVPKGGRAIGTRDGCPLRHIDRIPRGRPSAEPMARIHAVRPAASPETDKRPRHRLHAEKRAAC